MAGRLAMPRGSVAALVACGALAGFFVPALAATLIHSGDGRPAVLVRPRAIRVPRSDDQLPPVVNPDLPSGSSAATLAAEQRNSELELQRLQRQERPVSPARPVTGKPVRKPSVVVIQVPTAKTPSSNPHQHVPTHVKPGTTGGSVAPPVNSKHPSSAK